MFSAKPFTVTATSQLPVFRTNPARPFEVTGADFAGSLIYKVTTKEDGKCYLIIFTRGKEQRTVDERKSGKAGERERRCQT